MIYTSKNVRTEWRSADTTTSLNTSLCVQEDTSPRNSRLRRTQVSFLFSQHSYLRTVLISVFTVFGLSRRREIRLYVFRCVCFVCFRSRSYPVPHRGERVKQGIVHPRNIAIITSQNILYCFRCILLQFQDYMFGLAEVSCNIVSPSTIVSIWINLTFIALMETLTTSVQTQI
jgi:hypothetical protein